MLDTGLPLVNIQSVPRGISPAINVQEAKDGVNIHDYVPGIKSKKAEPTLSGMYPKKDFQKILEQERVRTDRTGHEFSIVVFEIADSKDYESVIQYLSYVLSQRVRCYDEIGWITEQRLGVILPGTLAQGAQKLADDICSLIIPKASHPKYSIFTYPSNWINSSQGSCSESDEIPASNHFKTKTWAESKILRLIRGMDSPAKRLGRFMQQIKES